MKNKRLPLFENFKNESEDYFKARKEFIRLLGGVWSPNNNDVFWRAVEIAHNDPTSKAFFAAQAEYDIEDMDDYDEYTQAVDDVLKSEDYFLEELMNMGVLEEFSLLFKPNSRMTFADFAAKYPDIMP